MNLSKFVKVTRVLKSVVAGTTDQNGSVIDMSGFEGVQFIALFGALTATQVTSLKVQQGDLADGSDMADLAGSLHAALEDRRVLIYEMGRVAPAPKQFWPLTRSSINTVTIRLVAGYGGSPQDVPQAIRHGIMIEIADLYENREDVLVGQTFELMAVSERLLWPYRALFPV